MEKFTAPEVFHATDPVYLALGPISFSRLTLQVDALRPWNYCVILDATNRYSCGGIKAKGQMWARPILCPAGETARVLVTGAGIQHSGDWPLIDSLDVVTVESGQSLVVYAWGDLTVGDLEWS